MKKTKFDKCFYSCPGAWTGFFMDDKTGLITVDPAKILEAAKHIKRYYTITRVMLAPSTTHPTLKNALFITIANK